MQVRNSRTPVEGRSLKIAIQKGVSPKRARTRRANQVRTSVKTYHIYIYPSYYLVTTSSVRNQKTRNETQGRDVKDTTNKSGMRIDQ